MLRGQKHVNVSVLVVASPVSPEVSSNLNPVSFFFLFRICCRLNFGLVILTQIQLISWSIKSESNAIIDPWTRTSNILGTQLTVVMLLHVMI
jgi:hypothetical protein